MQNVVDLAGPLDIAVADIGHAARDRGLFYVRGHGVAPATIDAQFALARAFFALDFDEKCEIEVQPGTCFRGYEPYGTRTIDASAPGDLKEGFIMGPDLPADHPHVRAAYPNTGANRWPRRPSHFRSQIETYVAAMNVLGARIAQLLARSLELPPPYFDAMLREPLTYSQLFHYPSVPQPPEHQRYGAGAHTDWGFITILLQDDVGGLELRDDDGGWLPAPPLAGTFVVILGELIVRLTDGRYRAAPHRVARNVSGRSRYSMPTFIDPGYDEIVGCVPTCRPAFGEPRYPSCTVAEHMREMARETFSAR